MKQRKKVISKILSLLTALAVVMSMVPMMAMADGGDTASTIQVKVRAQMDTEFEYISDLLEVSSDIAEYYGYKDGILPSEGVSALDVLVAAHKQKYGNAFSVEDAKNYLTVNDSGNAVKMFGAADVDKRYTGFAINHAYPKKGSTGYMLNQAPVSDKDTVDFFYYQDSMGADYLTWFEDEKGSKPDTINVAAGYNFKLSVNRFMYMSGYTDYESSAIINESKEFATIVDADNTGITYGDLAETDANGFVTLKFDNPGIYHLTALGYVEDYEAPMLNPYLTVVVSAVDSKMYYDNEEYDAASDITVKLGSKHNLTGYVTDSNGIVYEPCSFNTYYAAELGIDASADDATYGYGASMTFTPAKAGRYNVTLDSLNGTVKSFNIKVEPNDLRNLASGPLDFYSYREGDESSMLGNNWYAGKELKAAPGESSDEMTKDYRYLSAYTTVPPGTTCENMTVNWYYSDVYSKTGNGYKKVNTSGRGKGTKDNLTYYNGDGYGDTYFFNITPDTTKSGTFYYYVTVSDGTNTISSVTNQAVVCVGTPNAPLDGIEDGSLKFYKSAGYDYSMLGNNWYSGNELKVNVGDSEDVLGSNSKYLAADIEAIEGKELSDYTVSWYYSDTYKADGSGYKQVKTETAGAAGNKNYGKQLKAKSGNISYQYTDIRTSLSYPSNYIDLRIYPDTTKQGTYYYYAVISDGTNTISSITSQAMVIVSPVSSSADGNTSTAVISTSFRLDGYGKFPGIASATKSISKGATAFDLFKIILEAKGYSFTRNNSDYVSSVTSNNGNTLGEFDEGPNSGWMYRVNGYAPNVGMNSYVLNEGDNVVFYYVQDYTKDPYANISIPTPTISITDSTGKDASSMGSVKYDAISNCVNITPAAGYKVADVKVNGVSKGAVTKLEGIKSTDKIEVVFEAEKAEPEKPVVSDKTKKIIAGVKATTVKTASKKTKKGITVSWKKSAGYKVSYYQIFRKAGKKGTYKKVYTTKNSKTVKYTNNKNLKKGTLYSYKVRGVRVIGGKKYYTKWSPAVSKKY